MVNHSSKLSEYKTGQIIPDDFEKAILSLGWKTDFIFLSKHGHNGVLEDFLDISRCNDKNHINLRTLASLSVNLSDGRSIIACYCENLAGEGTISYAECSREKAEQCIKVMTPNREVDSRSLAEYILAADIHLKVSLYDGRQITDVDPRTLGSN